MNPTSAHSLSMPNLMLRVEGAALLIAALAAYAATGGDWLAFVVLLLAPDLSMIGYLVNPRVGGITYDVVHNYALPLLALAAAWALTSPALLSVAIIWIAHISMDRMLGYGLKYATAFKDTHLQRV